MTTIKTHDCNTCTRRGCKGDVLVIGNRTRSFEPKACRIVPQPCPGMLTDSFRVPLGEQALAHPQSLHNALSALPFATYSLSEILR